MTSEVWKPVAGLEGYYEVSNHGRVRSLRFVNGNVDKPRKAPFLMRQSKSGPGYQKVCLDRKGRLVHRLVLEAFVGPCPEGMECAHLNGDSKDNRLDNLAWVTPMTNQIHKMQHGTTSRGEKNWNAKLTAKQVMEIRVLYAQGASMADIARQFGRTDGCIYSVVKRFTWRHLPDALLGDGKGEAK